jgi:hypothetical protein
VLDRASSYHLVQVSSSTPQLLKYQWYDENCITPCPLLLNSKFFFYICLFHRKQNYRINGKNQNYCSIV